MELDDDLDTRLNASAPRQTPVDPSLFGRMSRAARRQVRTKRPFVAATAVATAVIIGTSSVAIANAVLSGSATVSTYGQSVTVSVESGPRCEAVIVLQHPTGDSEKDAATIASIEANAQAWLSDLTLTDADLSVARAVVGGMWHFDRTVIDEDNTTTLLTPVTEALLTPVTEPDPATVARVALAHKFDEWLQEQVSKSHAEAIASDVQCLSNQ